MSKKDEVLNSLSFWQGYHSKALTTFLAICGFAFGAAGGVIPAPLWLMILSIFGALVSGVAVLILHKKIIKLQQELGKL